MTTTLTEAIVPTKKTRKADKADKAPSKADIAAAKAAEDIIAARDAEGVAAEALTAAATSTFVAITVDGASTRKVASLSGESRSTVQRLELTGQVLAKDGEIDVPEGEALARIIRTVVIAAEGKVGIPAARGLISAAADKAAAVKALRSAKPADKDDEDDKNDKDDEDDKDEPESVDGEDDFAAALSQAETALAQVLHHKPVVAFTADEKTRVDALLATVKALAAHKGNGN